MKEKYVLYSEGEDLSVNLKITQLENKVDELKDIIVMLGGLNPPEKPKCIDSVDKYNRELSKYNIDRDYFINKIRNNYREKKEREIYKKNFDNLLS